MSQATENFSARGEQTQIPGCCFRTEEELCLHYGADRHTRADMPETKNDMSFRVHLSRETIFSVEFLHEAMGTLLQEKDYESTNF